ncbi:hypothetical protein J7K50_06385 [bacterium]|nr:hypothetical protein [bacterium]
MSDQSINHSVAKAKYYISFPRLRYVFSEAELPDHSYVKVMIDPAGRHLRRLWVRADGRMVTREELQYDVDGRLTRLEVFDEEDRRKGFTVYEYHAEGRICKHRFDAKSKPTDVVEETRNVRGFLLWEHHQRVVEHGSRLETVLNVEYSYPEPGIRRGEYIDVTGELTHIIVDHFNENGDLLATERFDAEGEVYLHSEYKFDAGGRVLARIDTDSGGNVLARVNYQH